MFQTLPAPAGAADLLAAEIARAVRDRSLPGGLSDRIQPGQLTATVPHPVHVLRLDQLVASFTPTEAERGGWRHLLEVRREAVAEAEIRETAAGPQFCGIWTGPLAAAAVRAITLLEPQLATSGDYLVAALDIPALAANLLWLQSTAGADQDVFVSLSACPTVLMRNRPYTRRDLEALLVPLARTLAEELRTHPLTDR